LFFMHSAVNLSFYLFCWMFPNQFFFEKSQ
jgi:hypothetical protein